MMLRKAIVCILINACSYKVALSHFNTYSIVLAAGIQDFTLQTVKNHKCLASGTAMLVG